MSVIIYAKNLLRLNDNALSVNASATYAAKRKRVYFAFSRKAPELLKAYPCKTPALTVKQDMISLGAFRKIDLMDEYGILFECEIREPVQIS